ncbi:hypothetical protein HY946_02860 [Candidatus Gottesmanbacteria bacterium]|nr:hypothetical protein [Candidatus Gottesmanbacteria bacterium]
MTSLPKLAKIIISITLFLLLLQVVVANRLTTAGLTLDSLADQEQELRQENELLERKIATFSSLTQVAQKAAEAGFVKPQPFYLIPEFPVAQELNVNAPR